LSKVFFEVRMKYSVGIKTTVMCDNHAARCSKFPKHFLDFKMIQDPGSHCRWCDKDASSKQRIAQWAADNGINKIMTSAGAELTVEEWIDVMLATSSDP